MGAGPDATQGHQENCPVVTEAALRSLRFALRTPGENASCSILNGNLGSGRKAVEAYSIARRGCLP